MKHPAVILILFTLSSLWLSPACTRGGEEPTDPRTEATEREAPGNRPADPRTPAPIPSDTVGYSDGPGAPPAASGGDRDGDGVLDADDRCPDDPEDRDGFQDDDGCPDADNDGDGVPDMNDRCPTDPEDLDGYQDDDGCPEP